VELPDGGVPGDMRTLVVVPTLLTSPVEIEAQVERLEVHFLSSPKGEIYFALLSDWLDADSEHIEDDEELLAIASRAIARLNRKHATEGVCDRFHLLHRRRVWTASERKWLGWERKRGKLSELNDLLAGVAADTTFVRPDAQPLKVPEKVRYVITLDADTRLTPDAVRRLIGKMAHPLNAPQISPDAKRVTEGYAILQPRVTPAMPSGEQETPFLRIFSSTAGIDPYAAAASDVYQDLLGEGSYTGKGIYDVAAFRAALAGRVPASTLLSHDLLEGVFARSGLASDIEFVETFPARYDSAAMRHHRWARGDWQLLPWILGLERTQTPRSSRTGTPLSGRWKMLDNLRRSMSAPAAALALLAGFASRPGASLIWTAFILATLALPPLIPLIGSLTQRSRTNVLRYRLRTLRSDVRMALAQWFLAVTFLAHQAWLMGDAAIRTLFRLASGRNLLEWTPAAHAMLGERPTLFSYYRYMGGAVALAAAAALIGVSRAQIEPSALVLALLWGASPAIAVWVSKPPRPRKNSLLAPSDATALRLIARRTWRYFETFVTPAHNALPPDNFQESPEPIVAMPMHVHVDAAAAPAPDDLAAESQQHQPDRQLEPLAHVLGNRQPQHEAQTGDEEEGERVAHTPHRAADDSGSPAAAAGGQGRDRGEVVGFQRVPHADEESEQQDREHVGHRTTARCKRTGGARGGSELEEVVERLASARGARCRCRAGLAFDADARREERAGVPDVLRTHAGGDRLPALESRARVERDAVQTGVQIDAAFRAPRVGRDGGVLQVAAARATEPLAEAGHVGHPGVPRHARVARLGRALRSLRSPLAAARRAVVLVATLAIFPIRHGSAP
jgi:hypothetical protein